MVYFYRTIAPSSKHHGALETF